MSAVKNFTFYSLHALIICKFPTIKYDLIITLAERWNVVVFNFFNMRNILAQYFLSNCFYSQQFAFSFFLSWDGQNLLVFLSWVRVVEQMSFVHFSPRDNCAFTTASPLPQVWCHVTTVFTALGFRLPCKSGQMFQAVIAPWLVNCPKPTSNTVTGSAVTIRQIK